METLLTSPVSSTIAFRKQCSSGDETLTMEDVSLSDESVLLDSLLSPDPPTPLLVSPSTSTITNDDPVATITSKNFYGGSPVIGILSQPRICTETGETEYVIAASYVKWVEGAGARVMPIPWNATEEMVREIFPQINGLLFPGGNSILPVAARVLWDLAQAANNQGDFFPIWGTCLGYEYLLMLASGKDEFVMEGGYVSHNVSWPVDLTEERSQLYAKPSIRDIATEQPVTMNNHEFGIQPDTFQSYPGLMDTFRITSVNQDCKGKPFVSTMESKYPQQFPYYGVQYHPEKNAFEYGAEPGSNTPYENINHSADALYFSFHLASFFVSLARQNLDLGKHVYTSFERLPLIYHYEARSGLKFQQYYLIPAIGATNGETTHFVGKDFSWKLDDYLADHVGIYKTEYTDE